MTVNIQTNAFAICTVRTSQLYIYTSSAHTHTHTPWHHCKTVTHTDPAAVLLNHVTPHSAYVCVFVKSQDGSLKSDVINVFCVCEFVCLCEHDGITFPRVSQRCQSLLLSKRRAGCSIL